MVTVTCPWCEEDGSLSLADLAALETSFSCPECGITIEVVSGTAAELDLAA